VNTKLKATNNEDNPKLAELGVKNFQ